MTARDEEASSVGRTVPGAIRNAELSTRHARHVKELWQRLDPHGEELDLRELKKGFQRIDHPMKNADGMLRQIIKLVDANGDGKIQYEEFRVFVEAAEHELLILFRSMDRNHDGLLSRDDLRTAFQKTGLSVSERRLSGFFDEIDVNHDNYISFEEWRDFLLFIPTHGSASKLATAFSFYASTVVLNAEGDSLVSDDTLEGLDTAASLLYTLFGSLLKLAQPTAVESKKAVSQETEAKRLQNQTRAYNMQAQHNTQLPQSAQSSQPILLEEDLDNMNLDLDEFDAAGDKFRKDGESAGQVPSTQYLPHPGYFLAGALAGGISRTATAPFDRLKVYLLVSTHANSNTSINTALHGHPLAALHNATRPICEAITSLYKAGGLKTFFAGNGLNVIKIMPETAIKFGSYEAAKRTCAAFEGHSDPMHINPYSKFVAGGVAGMIAQFCVYPLDTLKFRLQCETVAGGPTGRALLAQTAQRMMQSESGGWRAAYRGVTMGLIGMFPYSAIDMGTFELLKSAVVRYKARHHGLDEKDIVLGSVVTGVIGAASGAFGACVVYPLNVLRTRLQTQGTVMHPPAYTGIWDVARRTLAHEGWHGLYKGLTPNLMKVAPALSITWVVYEKSKTLLGLP